MKLRRTVFWASGGSFALGSMVGGVIYSAIEVYGIEDFDPKFRGDPRLAFSLDLMGVGFLTTIGTIAYLIFLRKCAKLRPMRSRHLHAAGLAVIAGTLYFPAFSLIGSLLRLLVPAESLVNPAVAGLFVVAYPFLLAVLSHRVLAARPPVPE